MGVEQCNSPPGNSIQKALWAITVQVFVEMFVRRDLDIQFQRRHGMNTFTIAFPSADRDRYRENSNHYEEGWEPGYY